MNAGLLSISEGLDLNDGFKIPRLAFGTFELKGDDAKNGVSSALEMGYRLIDCARFYNNEKLVGAAIAESGIPRNELFIESKVWNDRQLDGTVRESLEDTLRDLRLDYLDAFIIHWPVADRFVDTYRQLLDFKDEGLVRSVGVSNFQKQHLEELEREGLPAPAFDQMEHHPYMQDEDALGYCRERGIVYQAWSPLGRSACLGDSRIGEIAAAHDASPAQVILAWHVANGVVPLPRSMNPEHILANAESLELELADEELAAIDAMNRHEYVIPHVQPSNFADALNSLSSHFD